MGVKLNLLTQYWGPSREILYRWRRRLATAAVLLLIFDLGYHVVFGANGLMVYSRKRTEYKFLQGEVDRLQHENDQLSKNIKSLKTDPQTIEKEAREQLRYARPGEVIYTMPAATAAPSAATAQNR